jgi:hypothetical protein
MDRMEGRCPGPADARGQWTEAATIKASQKPENRRMMKDLLK